MKLRLARVGVLGKQHMTDTIGIGKTEARFKDAHLRN